MKEVQNRKYILIIFYYCVRVEDDELNLSSLFFSILFLFSIYFLILNLELEVSVISNVTVTY